MIKGIDVSHWQGKIDWVKVKSEKVDFAIMKATQGTTFVDSRFSENKEGARKQGILCGYYHFADGGNAKQEAEHFVKTVGELREGELLVLDYEIDLSNPAQWCLAFLDRVKELTGIKPLLYTNEARALSIDWIPVVIGDYGLWVAKYGQNDGKPGKVPSSGKWPFYVLWQYTSSGTVKGINGLVDLNQGDISLETLKKYGKQPERVAAQPEVEKMVMREDFIKAIEALTGDNYGDNMNENEQKRAAKELKKVAEELKELKSRPEEKVIYVDRPVEIVKEVQDLALAQELEKTKKALEEQKALTEKNAGDTRIIDALVFFLRAIKSRL